jgi:hypothetical protein
VNQISNYHFSDWKAKHSVFFAFEHPDAATHPKWAHDMPSGKMNTVVGR